MTKTDRAALICGLAESLKESVSVYEKAEATSKWKPVGGQDVTIENSCSSIVRKCMTLRAELSVLIHEMEGKNVS